MRVRERGECQGSWWERWGEGQAQGDAKAAGGEISGLDGSLASVEAGLDDGQAEAGAAGVAGAGVFGTEERFEQAGEGFGGHAGSLVVEVQGGLGGADIGMGTERAGVAGIADGVTEDIGDGALEEGGIGEDGEIGGEFVDQGGVGLGFAGPGALEDEVDGDGFEVGGSAVGGAGEGEEFLDEGGHFVEVLGEVMEGGVVGGGGMGIEDGHGGLHTGDGGGQFVGGIAEEPALAGDLLSEAFGHAIDGLGEAAEFVLSAEGEAIVEAPGGDGFGLAGEAGEVAGDTAEVGEPEGDGDGEGGETGEGPGTDIEEQTAGPGMAGAQEEEGGVGGVLEGKLDDDPEGGGLTGTDDGAGEGSGSEGGAGWQAAGSEAAAGSAAPALTATTTATATGAEAEAGSVATGEGRTAGGAEEVEDGLGKGGGGRGAEGGGFGIEHVKVEAGGLAVLVEQVGEIVGGDEIEIALEVAGQGMDAVATGAGQEPGGVQSDLGEEHDGEHGGDEEDIGEQPEQEPGGERETSEGVDHGVDGELGSWITR